MEYKLTVCSNWLFVVVVYCPVMKMGRLGTRREPARCSSSAVGEVSCNGVCMHWDAAWSSLCPMDPLPPMSLLKAGPHPWCSRFCLSSKNHWHHDMSWWTGIPGLCVLWWAITPGIHMVAQQMGMWGPVMEVHKKPQVDWGAQSPNCNFWFFSLFIPFSKLGLYVIYFCWCVFFSEPQKCFC